MKVFIYTLKCPISNDIIYVGSTKSPESRLQGHISQSLRTNTNIAKYIRLNSIIPIFEILEEVKHKNYIQVENYWIEQFGQWGFNLLNSLGNKNKVYIKCKNVASSKNIRITNDAHAIISGFCKKKGYNLSAFCEIAAMEKIKTESIKNL